MKYKDKKYREPTIVSSLYSQKKEVIRYQIVSK